jgi:hypothetical protein
VHAQVQVPFGSFLARAARQAHATACAGAAAEPPPEEALVAELKAAFADIDVYGAQGASRVSADEVISIPAP